MLQPMVIRRVSYHACHWMSHVEHQRSLPNPKRRHAMASSLAICMVSSMVDGSGCEQGGLGSDTSDVSEEDGDRCLGVRYVVYVSLQHFGVDSHLGNGCFSGMMGLGGLNGKADEGMIGIGLVSISDGVFGRVASGVRYDTSVISVSVPDWSRIPSTDHGG